MHDLGHRRIASQCTCSTPFWRHGIPALTITDTALYRYPHYHLASDTPDKLDYDRLARVVAGLDRTFRALDERL